MNNFRRNLIVVLVMVFVTSTGFANVGLPMILINYPVVIIGLPLVILVECGFFMWKKRVKVRQIIWPISLANLISTIFGYPFAWFFHTGFGLAAAWLLHLTATAFPQRGSFLEFAYTVTVSGAWLSPLIRDNTYIAVASILGLVPAFFLSVYLEKRTITKWFSFSKLGLTPIDIRNANIVSYVILALMAGTYFLLFPITDNAR